MMGGMGPGMGGMGGVHNAGNNDAVDFEKPLGEGVFGEVWRARHKGQLCAAKITKCPTGFRSEELALLKKAQGPHTVPLIALEEMTPKGTAIVMALAERSLDDKVKGRRRATEKEFLHEVHQVLQGLDWLHKNGIIFGDVKPDNMLIHEGRIVFADFGDARDATVRDTRPVHEQGWGSPMYHAKPDVMQQRMTVKSDLWMMGQTAIHLWSGQPANCNPSPIPSDIPLKSLVQRCLSSKPDGRPSAAEALAECSKALQAVGSPPGRPPRPPSRSPPASNAAPRGRSRTPPRSTNTGGLSIGGIYTIAGIKARPELNNQSCTIMLWVAETGRYTVQLASSQEEVAMKPDNLRSLDAPGQEYGSSGAADGTFLTTGTECKVFNLASRPDLNGQACVVQHFLPGTGRYSVQLVGTGEEVAVKPNCLYTK